MRLARNFQRTLIVIERHPFRERVIREREWGKYQIGTSPLFPNKTFQSYSPHSLTLVSLPFFTDIKRFTCVHIFYSDTIGFESITTMVFTYGPNHPQNLYKMRKF